MILKLSDGPLDLGKTHLVVQQGTPLGQQFIAAFPVLLGGACFGRQFRGRIPTIGAAADCCLVGDDQVHLGVRQGPLGRVDQNAIEGGFGQPDAGVLFLPELPMHHAP